jgi:hypothetical protein
MEWVALVLDWDGQKGHVIFQDDLGNLYRTSVMPVITPQTIAEQISKISGTPLNRVVFHDTKKKIYGGTTYRFAVFPF